MHWNNGRFHENLHVGKTIYITNFKHIAVFGDKGYVGYGSPTINSYIYGKNVGIDASSKYYTKSEQGSNLQSKKYIHIETGSDNTDPISDTGDGIEIVSKNGDTTVKSTNNAVNIMGGTYLNLNSNSGITINNISYGTSLPINNNIEGKIFFKLIS